MTKKEIFGLLSRVAWVASRAAEQSGTTRELDELKRVIEENEKQHRAFGRRLVGPSATRGRFTVSQAVDLFVVRTLAEGYGRKGFAWERQLKGLVGLREDYVRAAILMADDRFRDAFEKGLCAEFETSSARTPLWRAADAADYSKLVEGDQ